MCIRDRLKTGLLLFKYLKAGLFARLSTLLRVNATLGEIEDGEYYISNLAVYPEYQGKGLGTRLLRMAEDKAREFGASRIVLDVEAGNKDAIRLYKKIGYTVATELREIGVGKERLRFLRMIKLLAPRAFRSSGAE